MTELRDEHDWRTPLHAESSGADDEVIPHVRLSQRAGGERPGVRRSTRETTLGINLTSMIDVVFLLLIYFMVATEFKVGEEVYRLDLPQRTASQRPSDPFDLDVEPLRVHVASIGSNLDAYRITLDGPYDQPRSFQQFHEFLRDHQIGRAVSGGLFEPDHPIIITPARTTSWQHAIEAFNAAARAEYTNITFAKSS